MTLFESPVESALFLTLIEGSGGKPGGHFDILTLF